MGCWNGTCAISNLPIKHGDKIKVVVIQNNQNPGHASGFCYETGMAKPVSFIFEGEYNDYGMIENIQDNPVNDIFVDYFNEGLKSESLTIGPRADCEPDSLINILELIEREQILSKNTYWDEETQRMQNGFSELGIMMFHASIVDKITETLYNDSGYWLKDYTPENLKKMAIQALQKDKKHDFMMLIRSLNDELKEETDPGEKILIEKEIEEAYEKMFKIKDLRENYENKFRSLVSSEMGNPIVFEGMLRSMRALPKEQKLKYVQSLIDMLNLMQSMSSVRKHWGPCSGKGSQSDDHSPYRALIEGMNGIITKSFFERYDDEELDCIKSFKTFSEGQSYVAKHISDNEIVFEDELPSVTFSEIENNFEL